MDTDEYFTPEDWASFPEELGKIHMGTSNAVCELITYWKDFDHIFDPADSHKPTVAVRPKKVVFFDKRACTDKMEWKVPFKMHHLSWVRTDDEVKQKVQNYAHALDFDGETWYNNIWKKWVPDMVGIRPYGVEKQTKAIPGSLPGCIRSYFG